MILLAFGEWVCMRERETERGGGRETVSIILQEYEGYLLELMLLPGSESCCVLRSF